MRTIISKQANFFPIGCLVALRPLPHANIPGRRCYSQAPLVRDLHLFPAATRHLGSTSAAHTHRVLILAFTPDLDIRDGRRVDADWAAFGAT